MSGTAPAAAVYVRQSNMESATHHRRIRRPLSAAGVALAVVAIAAPVADAKIWFGDLGGRRLRWDDRVSTTIANCPGNDSCRAAVEGVTVYLGRGRVTRATVDRRRLHRLGRVSANGTLAFAVPHAPAGRYHLVALVPAGDQHRWLPVSESFRVTARRP